MQDVLEHPDRYSAELVSLARDLSERRRQMNELTTEEAQLLNVGSLEFYQYRPPPQEKAKPRASATPRAAQPVEAPATPEIGVDVPEGADPRLFWWT